MTRVRRIPIAGPPARRRRVPVFRYRGKFDAMVAEMVERVYGPRLCRPAPITVALVGGHQGPWHTGDARDFLTGKGPMDE